MIGDFLKQLTQSPNGYLWQDGEDDSSSSSDTAIPTGEAALPASAAAPVPGWQAPTSGISANDVSNLVANVMSGIASSNAQSAGAAAGTGTGSTPGVGASVVGTTPTTPQMSYGTPVFTTPYGQQQDNNAVMNALFRPSQSSGPTGGGLGNVNSEQNKATIQALLSAVGNM